MQSKNYERAQAMVLMDKYNMSQNEFNEALAALAKRYFDVDAIQTEAYLDDTLKITVTLSVKKVKQIRRILA